MKLQFDINNIVEDFTIVLSTRWYEHYGQIRNVKRDSVTCKQNMNAANELSFEVYKTLDGMDERLWDDIVDLKLVWVKELNEYYEINVSLDDSINPCKIITATSLCEAELSQVNLYNIEINSEADIERDAYEVTKFYNEDNHKASLLHRILDKVPHYRIKHVDSSLKNLQRTFSIDGTSVYDWLGGECSEQFNCIFIFDTTDRSISVYDLYTVCKGNKEDGTPCGHRGEFDNVCPECGSTNLKYFGEDTTIFIDKENLTDLVKFETDIGSVKNCFKLVAGDDDMTVTVRLLNPNGTDYIYYISDEQKEDMPKELVEKIESYDELVAGHTEEYEQLVEEMQEVRADILYYEHEMMPTIEHAVVTASTEAAKLTTANLSPLALEKVTSSTSKSTVESALKNYAKVYVKTGYVKLEINQSAYTYVKENVGTWTGNFKVTNYSDEEDIAYSEVITVDVYGGYEVNEDFVRQKVMKAIASEDDEEGSIFDVLSIEELDDFKEAIKLYCKVRLESFADAIESARDVLIQLDQANEEADLYSVFYEPYTAKLEACRDEIDLRDAKIEELTNQYNKLDLRRNEIQKTLNFETYLGDELHSIFCSYRREDTYSNDNYISEGLDNAETFAKAKDFIQKAKEELYKSAMRQHSISSTLHNLLIMPEFEVIIDKFELGNWIRIRVDEKIYRLRLISYEINFSDIQTLNVEFSDVSQQVGFASDIKSILDSAQQMATNYNYISKQAEKGESAQRTFDQMKEEGLDSALMQVNGGKNGVVTIGSHGILCKNYNDTIDDFDQEQLIINNNILAFSDDGLRSVKTALGKHNYYKYNNEGNLVKDTAYGLTSDFVTAGYINGSQIISGDIYSHNYSPTKKTGAHIDLNNGSFTLANGKIVYDNSTNVLNLKGVTLDWNTTTPPTVDNVDGLNDKLEDINSSIVDLDEKFADELTDYVTNTIFNGSIAELQSQIDGNITTWFEDGVPTLNSYPSNEWKTTDEKNKHLGDLYYDNITGYAYRFQLTEGVYEWLKITDTDVVKALADAKHAQDTADGKRRVFVVTPVPPYDIGDLWAQGDKGELMKCIKARTDKESYVSTDWAKASKYTDDSALHSFIEEDYADDLELINQQIDKKAETWYQNTDPSVKWTTVELKDVHVGDLWFNIDENKSYIYTSSHTWQEADGVPDDVYDAIDGKAQIFSSQPTTPYYEGDLYVQGKNGDIYVCQTERLTGNYSSDDWVLASKYTDDTELYLFINGDFKDTINAVKMQADQKAETWYQETDPSVNWTTEEKKSHVGDLWYSTKSEKTYIWNGTKWEETKSNPPSEVFDEIDGKAQIFVGQPTVPYRVGDLWFNSETSDIMTCIKDRLEGNFTSSDWEKRNKYTDDSALETFVDGAYADDLEVIAEQIDKRAQTWYLTKTEMDKEVATWTDKSIHVGDLWYRTDASDGDDKTFMYNSSYTWEVMNGVPKDVFDKIDGKANIYTTKPTTYNIGDLLIPSSTFTVSNVTFEKNKVYRANKTANSFSTSDWTEINYSDDTSLNEFINGSYSEAMADINTQIDAKADTYYQSTAPHPEYTKIVDNSTYNLYVGDLWFNTNENKSYMYVKQNNSTSGYYDYVWKEIDGVPDEIYDELDGKSTIYTSKPSSQRNGDLLIPNTTFTETYNSVKYTFTARKIYRCTETKNAFIPNLWTEVAYTDNTELNAFINETYAENLTDIQGQIDKKTDTYYQATAPHAEYKNVASNTTYDSYVGDLWHNTTENKTYRYTKIANGSNYNYVWSEMDGVPDSVFDSIDTKKSIYVSLPTSYNVNDIYILETDRGIWKSGTLLVAKNQKTKQTTFLSSDWMENVRYTDDTSLNEFINNDFKNTIDAVKTQADQKAETWYQETDPSLTWSDEEKQVHAGDLWYSISDEKTYIWNGTSWNEAKSTPPSEVFDAIDGKSTIYVNTPPSQEKGDLMIPSASFQFTYNSEQYSFSKGKIYRCTTTSSTFVPKYWIEVSYTDDSALETFITGAYADALKDIGTQIDGKARAWYQSTDPSLTWNTDEDHEGDLWYNTSSNSHVTSIYQNGAWKSMSVPKEVFDTIDGIASIYVTIPKNPQLGDLLIPSSDLGKYKAGKVYKYNGTAWVEILYTDDTKANEALDAANKAQITADSAKGVAENAETIGNNLVNVLGYDGTKITGTYIYSPVISGGSILVGDKEGTYAEITPEGILNCAGANIKGTINAISGNIGGWTTNKTQIFKSINLYDDMTSAGLSGLADDDPVQYWVWIRSPVNSTTPVLGIYYKRKSDYLAGNDTVYRIFSAQTNGVVYANSFNSSNANITGGKINITTNTEEDSKIILKYNYNSQNLAVSSFKPEGFVTIGSGTTSSSSPCGVRVWDAFVTGGTFSSINENAYMTDYAFQLNTDSKSFFRKGVSVIGGLSTDTLSVSGTKSRVTSTENYNDRLLYCYETPSPMFGDLGEGQIDETGKCYVFLDDIFAETIDTDCIYQVFLQPYGKGECYVTERTSSYFVVEGTENLSFGWELKAIQKDFDTTRLEEPKENETDSATTILNETYSYLDSMLYNVESEEF